MYLVRQYNRKRNAELRLRRERRKMLEKARLKGKKGQTNSQSNTGRGGGNDEEFEDDGLCCTCGQKVGQHNHVPTGGIATSTAIATARGRTRTGKRQVMDSQRFLVVIERDLVV